MFHVPSIYSSHSKYPREQEALIHVHGQTKVDRFENTKVLKVRTLDQFICHCSWYRLNFTLGNEHAAEKSMGSHASPDLWISTEKIQDQQNSETHFVMLSSAGKKSSETLGTTIESAEVDYTKPEDEFR